VNKSQNSTRVAFRAPEVPRRRNSLDFELIFFGQLPRRRHSVKFELIFLPALSYNIDMFIYEFRDAE